MGLLRIEAPHFVAGIESYNVDEGQLRRAHRCAPIVKYMKWWTLAEIVDYCSDKGWECTYITIERRDRRWER